MTPAEGLKELAGDVGKEKDKIDEAARLSGLSRWRAFDIWYGKARRVGPDEIQKISDAVQHKRDKAARNELAQLRLRIERLDALLRQTDPDFHRPTIDFLGAPVSRQR